MLRLGIDTCWGRVTSRSWQAVTRRSLLFLDARLFPAVIDFGLDESPEYMISLESGPDEARLEMGKNLALNEDQCKLLVRTGRVELPFPCGSQILSLVRLPIPPRSRWVGFSPIITRL